MKITSKDIAKACGVSRGTVDRALNNRPGINEVTKELIYQTANKLGYKPDFLASCLSKGRTMTIGLVVFDVHNRFFAQMVNEIEVKARETGYFVYLTLTNGDSSTEKECMEHLIGRKVDGIILCSVINDGTNYYRDFNIPLVAIGNRISAAIPFVGVNDYLAMQEASELLLEKGYKNIVYVSPPLSYEDNSNIFAQKQRFLGFIDAVSKSSNTISSVTILSKEYLQEIDKVTLNNIARTAILCSSDIYALEVLNHLKDKGVDVPKDIGLMGFDNVDILKYVEPRLTTVSYPIKDIAIQAVESLLGQINGIKCTDDVIMKHEIIKGKSA